MKILALETTDPIGSIAAMDGSNLLMELDLNRQQRSAQSLAPGIKSLLDQVGWQPLDVQLVALTIGPGSFTGLRIGLTLAKTFAYAIGAEILGLDTLETIAQAAAGEICRVTAVLDAGRGEIVSRSFSRDCKDRWFLPDGEQRLLSIERWLGELRPGMAIAGPALGKLIARLPDFVVVLEKKYWRPRAAQVAQLAAQQYALGRRDDIWHILPHYYRKSAAEEKLSAKEQDTAHRVQKQGNADKQH
ncbi:MAG: tRNA (adenosine(37)-N6)-threonylcarbamoyltransferase complex dimerization subunit type 1 TsaB [Thermoguttaceae bacterium]